MRHLFFTWALLALSSAARAGFDDDFTGATLRLDLYHTGAAAGESIAVDRLRTEGDWPGRRARLTEDLNLGQYRLEVVDPERDRVLYREGFASIFGEWKTTGEARGGVVRTFEEALRFPEPRRPFEVRIAERDAGNEFADIWSQSFEPSHRSVHRAPAPGGDVVIVQESGPPASKVDLLFLGDGYQSQERPLFLEHVRRLTRALFEVEPFRTRRSSFNVRAIFTESPTSGVTHPRGGEFRDTPLGLSYNALDSDRYLLTLRSRQWRDRAAAAPYDFVILLANQEKYGGGGIYNLYCTAAARSSEAAYLVVHEFGHHFAGLADEYYTSPVSYQDYQQPDVEPWEVNATALLDPARLKWGDLATTEHLPTPWPKEEHDSLSRAFQARRAELRGALVGEGELTTLFEEERQAVSALLEMQRGVVGAFEGAMYESKGRYRPSIDCLMFSRDDVGFCPVCRRGLEAVIDLHAGAGP